jgi:hypothetical protein
VGTANPTFHINFDVVGVFIFECLLTTSRSKTDASAVFDAVAVFHQITKREEVMRILAEVFRRQKTMTKGMHVRFSVRQRAALILCMRQILMGPPVKSADDSAASLIIQYKLSYY